MRPAELRLERRERVAVGVARVAEAAEAHVDHARVPLHRPLDGLHLRLDVDQVVAVDDLRDEELGGGGGGDADGVVDPGRDQAGDEGSMALLVDARGAADERPPAILPAKSGWSASIPESITATLTAGSGVGVSQKSNVRLKARCHCLTASRSFGTARRVPSRST